MRLGAVAAGGSHRGGAAHREQIGSKASTHATACEGRGSPTENGALVREDADVSVAGGVALQMTSENERGDMGEQCEAC